MHVLIDQYIPFLNGVLDPYATVEFIAPEEFTPARVQDADALIVRTRTRINKDLLAGSRVQFVATATIGYDHIDTSLDIPYWTACPGCNAQAVCDYIQEALLAVQLPYKSIGIVGYGHVGSRVAAMAKQLGMDVLINDPPKGLGVSLDEIADQCDIITFHTPLDETTYHLCDAAFLSKCRPHALIINAARGGIVDEQALFESHHPCIIDCWENEPAIHHALCQSPQTLLASYHIAGYSVEGKRNASQMCLDALCRFFNLPLLSVNTDQMPPAGDSQPGWLTRVSNQLKAHPENFETLRKQYPLR
ncbi:MAG: 4-phosphoerythronate dehydrogenase [Bacteroidales bacterium]|nr:4-phosphoerythronate dehydrogenase [Candidatus Colicola equi]